MSHVALYREWRPQRFDQVAGQQHVVQTLTNAIKSDRAAHAYLFCGPRGTGKTSVARLLARALNCQEKDGAEPCNKCKLCTSIHEGSCFDVIEIDAASNRGIDEIRELRERVRYSPGEAICKVYIIDEVHMLTAEAFNALLKTLEEPPAYVVFIMATTEAHKVPLTILSRCQRFDFHRLSEEVIINRLSVVVTSSGAQVSPAALRFIARTAEGSMRDALSLLDQAISYCDEITEDDVAAIVGAVSTADLMALSKSIASRDTAKSLSIIHELISAGADPSQLLKSLVNHFRDLLLAGIGVSHLYDQFTVEELRFLAETAQAFGRLGILETTSALAEAEAQVKYASNPRVLLEIAVATAAVVRRTDAPEVKVEAVKVDNAPGAEQPAPMVDTSLSEDDFSQVWSAIVKRITERRPSIGPMVSDARAKLEGQTVMLSTTSDVHAEVLCDRRHLELITEECCRAIAKNVNVRFAKRDKGQTNSAETAGPIPSQDESDSREKNEAAQEMSQLDVAQTILGGIIVPPQRGGD